ncbi:PilT/PilU family type 4a pilus ATPase [Thermosulfuriphilus ammonigenes]|uniref:PilT/PilU family type 4a pilus ATPase n=1 Tax=Thermosulfuriphilus ammonigenes TaxID=1936021 RepID=A0A6G7PVV4_9BACT|nr:PilT/PilU family type 4a pilus ATPase [Thermosulfuriphilus ammonigenes]MBA2848138.1 twitching motility protein PilT [Thermosulfuriphilus ammonigenes]QIJ71686.1 PilT/PilU family type 4a pilus ATPase [Thermosulfuriphilus ammonigenes]
MRDQDVAHLIGYLARARERVTDLNFTVGRPLQVAADGRLHPVFWEEVPIEALTPFQTEILALSLIRGNERLLKDLVTTGSCDLSYRLPDGTRFRINIFSRQGSYSLVMRKLESRVPSIKELSLPKCFYQMAREKNGIILFTGATGTGKTTSLAAILDAINEEEAVHIVTLEDPVEYVHQSKKATFNQRELGLDFDHFASGLRAALRQAPNVILVGEIRDRETMEIALTAAETGHLVFSTLHTVNAGHTINRILGFFNTEEERQIRFRLADALRWIVCQKLLPKIGGGRVAIFEILYNNLRAKEAILLGEDEGRTFYHIIHEGSPYGMQTFDQHILELFKQGMITEETALAYCTRKDLVGRGIDLIKSARGEKTSDMELSLDLESDFQ